MRIRVVTFLVTASLLGLVQGLVSQPMLLLERYVPGGGWLEVLLLAVYAGWWVEKLRLPGRSAVWRRRLWGLFSAVFLTQLVLGLAGLERMLMTGTLHLPVPAMIVAGPLYRGGGLFMPILFVVTVMLVGPAWCSYLCYIGSWDSAMAHRRPRASPLPGLRKWVRFIIFGAVSATPLTLRWLEVAGKTAVWFGAGFGLVGIVWMVVWSRRSGSMTHCLTWCPMSILSSLLGKLSPFRIKIRDTCTMCLACSRVCRYDALSADEIRNGQPGFSCTLCGDCLRSCRERSIEYRFPGISPDRARLLFLVVVTSLHAAFLGVARL